MIQERYIKKFKVIPGKNVNLKRLETNWAPGEALKGAEKEAAKEQALEILEQNRRDLDVSQELLWASDMFSVLIILQGMDTAGKDGIIKHVMSGVNPQGCTVTSFKVPSDEELDHDFLWRYWQHLPRRGEIGVFNRSYYEEVLVVKVHPELIDRQRLPPGKRNKKFWRARYDDINAYERHLTQNGTVVLKFFLHISKEMQKERLLDRLKTDEKLWKFSVSDLAERNYWDNYLDVYEDMIHATSSEWAPWYVIPADHKWVARALVADIVSTIIRSLDLHYPTISDVQHAALEKARQQLEQE